MPVRVYWAKPGPAADDALRRYWTKAYEIAAEIVRFQETIKVGTQPHEDPNKPRKQRR